MNDLARLVAIEDIRRLEARYARYADAKRWMDLAGLFTEDGWFRPLDAEGEELFSAVGRAEIGSRLAARNSGDVQPIHQLFTHEIDVTSPTTATAIWAMADVIIRGDSAIRAAAESGSREPFRTMRGWGHYHVSYQQVDGHWYIATRTLHRTRLEFTY